MTACFNGLWVCPQQQSFEDFEDKYSNGFRGISAQLFAQTQTLFKELDDLSPSDVGATEYGYSPAPWVGFDGQAQEEFLIWRKALRKDIIPDESHPDGMVSHLGKSERLVAGLALSFHAMECVLADGIIKKKSQSVGTDSLNRAVAIWDVLRKHAETVYNLGHTSSLEAAHLIRSRIAKLGDEFSVRDVKQKRWRGLRDEKLIDEALDLLMDKKIIIEIEQPRRLNGRPPSRRFTTNRKLLKEDVQE